MIFAKNFARNYEKKIILETSDAWSTSHLSQRTSILYCRLSDFNIAFKFQPIKIQHSATSCVAVIG